MAEVAALPGRPGAVIFDMDGLMLDSERAILDALRAVAIDHRADIAPDWWLCLIGHTEAVCRAHLGSHIGDAAADALLEDGHARYVAVAEAGLPHRPGIVALLDLLVAHDVPRAVATSTRSPLAQHKLDAAGLLGYFDVICTSSDVTHPKPAPDVYLLAAERLGIAPSQCLVLEDSPTGVRAALAAGMTVVQVPDLLVPDEEVRALGHRIVGTLDVARGLIAPWLEPAAP